MASKNRRKKVQFHWTKELIILIVSLVAILTATIILALPSPKEKLTDELNTQITTYNSTNSTSYGTLTTENVYSIFDSYDELKRVKEESGYVYVFYGVYSSGTFLEQLSAIDTAARNNDVEKVYLYLANEVEDTEDQDSTTFKREMETRKNEISSNKLLDVKEIDFTEYPSLFVFQDGKLVFNSQTDEGSQLSWSIYINKAFTLGKEVVNQ